MAKKNLTMGNENSQMKIEELIEKINAFNMSVLKKNQGNLSEIEKDLLLNYLRELYDRVLFLKNNSHDEEKKTEIKTIEKEVHKEEKKPAIIIQQPTPPPVKKEVIEEIPKVIEQKQEQVKKTSSSVKTEMNLRTPPKPSVNEKFQNQTTGLSEKLGAKVIGDLKAAIGVNQRFGFINELFAKNTNEFESVIKQLNACKSTDEANNLLSNFKTKFKWDEKNPVVKEFLELVKRKFSKS